MCGRRLVILEAALVAALIGVGGSATCAADGPIGAVVRVTPEAFGTPPGAARIALGLRQTVVSDEVLETSATGMLHLRLIDDSDLWLDRNSLIVLDELVFDRATNTGEYLAELGFGLFRFVTGALPHDSYEVRTPTVVIGVRGTDFGVSVARDGATRISVYAGALVLRLRSGGPARVLEPPFTAVIAKPNGPILMSPFVWPVDPGAASVADRPLPGQGGTFGDLSQAGKVGVGPNDPAGSQGGQDRRSGQIGGGQPGGGAGGGGSSGVGP